MIRDSGEHRIDGVYISLLRERMVGGRLDPYYDEVIFGAIDHVVRDVDTKGDSLRCVDCRGGRDLSVVL
jgi:hypothetical protein